MFCSGEVLYGMVTPVRVERCKVRRVGAWLDLKNLQGKRAARVQFITNMKLYTVREVATIFKASERTIYTWIEAGYLRAVQIAEGNMIRIREEDLIDFIQRHLTIPEDIPQTLRSPSKSRIIANMKANMKSLLEEGESLK